MPKITFRGVKLLDFKHAPGEGGGYYEVNLAADFSDPVRKLMGWEVSEELESLFPTLPKHHAPEFDRAAMVLPKHVKSMGLEGEIQARNLELIPNGSDLAEHRMSLDCNQISWFNLQRIKQQNESFAWELRFCAIVPEAGAGAKLEAYHTAMADSKVAQMKVGYEKQEDLPLAENDEDEPQERLISEEQVADTEGADEDLPRTGPPKSHQPAKKDAPGSRRGAEQIPDPTVQ